MSSSVELNDATAPCGHGSAETPGVKPVFDIPNITFSEFSVDLELGSVQTQPLLSSHGESQTRAPPDDKSGRLSTPAARGNVFHRGAHYVRQHFAHPTRLISGSRVDPVPSGATKTQGNGFLVGVMSDDTFWEWVHSHPPVQNAIITNIVWFSSKKRPFHHQFIVVTILYEYSDPDSSELVQDSYNLRVERLGKVIGRSAAAKQQVTIEEVKPLSDFFEKNDLIFGLLDIGNPLIDNALFIPFEDDDEDESSEISEPDGEEGLERQATQEHLRSLSDREGSIENEAGPSNIQGTTESASAHHLASPNHETNGAEEEALAPDASKDMHPQRLYVCGAFQDAIDYKWRGESLTLEHLALYVDIITRHAPRYDLETFNCYFFSRLIMHIIGLRHYNFPVLIAPHLRDLIVVHWRHDPSGISRLFRNLTGQEIVEGAAVHSRIRFFSRIVFAVMSPLGCFMLLAASVSKKWLVIGFSVIGAGLLCFFAGIAFGYLKQNDAGYKIDTIKDAIVLDIDNDRSISHRDERRGDYVFPDTLEERTPVYRTMRTPSGMPYKIWDHDSVVQMEGPRVPVEMWPATSRNAEELRTLSAQ